MRSRFSNRVLGALAWVDRWVSAAGQNCCAGRSQTAWRKTQRREADEAIINPARWTEGPDVVATDQRHERHTIL